MRPVCYLRRILVLAVISACLVGLLGTGGEGPVALAMRPNQLTTSTITVQSFATSPSPLEQVFNGPFTVLSTTGTNLPCELWALNFTAEIGQYLSGSFNSDLPVGFFVVLQESYHDWVKAETCGSLTSAIAGQLLTTSYDFGPVAIPSSGIWAIVIVNSSNARDADGYLAAYLTTTPLTVTRPLTGTITLMSTITSTSTLLGGRPVPGFPFSSIILGIIVGLMATIALRRRNQHRHGNSTRRSSTRCNSEYEYANDMFGKNSIEANLSFLLLK